MDIASGLIAGFQTMLQPENFAYCLLGSLIGTLTGVLPGIGPLAALSLLLPVTFTLPPVAALGMLCAIFYGAMYGGSTTSILMNIPGEAASVITCIDGHQMARQGRAGAALGMAAIGSFVAGTISLVAMTLFSPLIVQAALGFGPPEFTALMTLGLIATMFMASSPPAKTLLMIALGLLLATVGMDVVNGKERFTFNLIDLSSGFDIVPVVIGLFGISEILLNLETLARNEILDSRVRNLLPTRRDWAESWRPILRGTGLGFGLGILPGGGPVTASFMSYSMERRLAARPETFGKGAIAGVAGPESANNAAVAGGMIPLLSLGLPSNAVTALLLGALMVQGVQPGPLMMVQHADIFWGVIASMYVGNVLLLLLNLPLVGLWVQLLRIPYGVLFPTILLMATVGCYAANKNMFDVWAMLGFGTAGYLLRKTGFELAPLVLAMVLGPMLEQALRQSLIMSLNGPMIFLTRPISAVLLVISLIAVVLACLRFRVARETS